MQGPITAPWGKYRAPDDADTEQHWLPLEAHCRDVATVFRHLAALPSMRVRLEAAAGAGLSKVQLERLAVIAFLHDIGKAHLGFQRKILPSATEHPGHVREIAPLLSDPTLAEQVEQALDTPTLASWFASPDDCFAFLVAAWSHHGDPVVFDPCDQTGRYHAAKTRWWRADADDDPMLTLVALSETARQALHAGLCMPGRTKLTT